MKKAFRTALLLAAIVSTIPVATGLLAGEPVRIGDTPPGVKKLGTTGSLLKTTGGKGQSQGASSKCPACGGSGFVSDEARKTASQSPIAMPELNCKLCNGTGKISKEEAGSGTKPPELDPTTWIEPQNAEARSWSTTNGATVNATLLKFNGRIAVLATEDGKLVQVSRNALSQRDQTVLRTMETARLAALREALAKKESEPRGRNEEQPDISSCIIKGCRGCERCKNIGNISSDVDAGIPQKDVMDRMIGDAFNQIRR